MTTLLAISTNVDDVEEHEGVPIPRVLGLSHAIHEYDGNYRLHRLYADSASVSIVLLAASLEYWKSVFADHSVSPAAQQVIKRYFEQNKDNPTLIEPNADSFGRRTAPDFLKAAYLGPVGFNLEQAIKTGEIAIDFATELGAPSGISREDVIDMIKDAGDNGFDRAYNDLSKTRHSLDDLLSDGSSELIPELLKAFQRGDDVKAKTLAWIVSREARVREILDEMDPKTVKSWDRIIQPAIDKLNSGV